MFGSGLANQRSQWQQAAIMEQERFLALHRHYAKRGMTLVSFYIDRRAGIERITVQRKTTIPKVGK